MRPVVNDVVPLLQCLRGYETVGITIRQVRVILQDAVISIIDDPVSNDLLLRRVVNIPHNVTISWRHGDGWNRLWVGRKSWNDWTWYFLEGLARRGPSNVTSRLVRYLINRLRARKGDGRCTVSRTNRITCALVVVVNRFMNRLWSDGLRFNVVNKVNVVVLISIGILIESTSSSALVFLS